jgi:hypothetical protein
MTVRYKLSSIEKPSKPNRRFMIVVPCYFRDSGGAGLNERPPEMFWI